jgi:hypothetical protein
VSIAARIVWPAAANRPMVKAISIKPKSDRLKNRIRATSVLF